MNPILWLLRSLHSLRLKFRRNPAPVEEPWDLTPETVAERFQRVRDAIPVDDEELGRAKPVARPCDPRRCIRCSVLTYTPDLTSDPFICAFCSKQPNPLRLSASAGEKMKTDWIKCSDRLPPSGKLVETKIDDEKGCRNETTLRLIGRLWFIPDGTTYVYYTPTHWRPV